MTLCGGRRGDDSITKGVEGHANCTRDARMRKITKPDQMGRGFQSR